jgi:outer membrane protein assembly factor BamB
MPNLRILGCALLASAIACGCGSRTPGPTPSAGPGDAANGDVTTYRGDAGRTGVMEGPGPWGNPAIAWQFQAGAPISSSPAVVGETAFLLSNDGLVRALDLSTGAVRWTKPLAAPTTSASPLVVDGSLIVGDKSGVVHALDSATGAERWSMQTDGPIDGAAAAVGGVVLTATEAGTAYALDARTGALTWKSTLPAGVTRSVTASADTVFVGAAGILVALRLSDGTMLWQTTVATSGACGTPTVAGGLVFDSTGLDGDDRSARGVVAVDAASGTVRWRFASPTQDQPYTPAVSAGRAYVVSEDKTVVALDTATGTVVWTMTTGAVNEALATIAGGVIYVPTNGHTLVALEAATGKIQWQAPIVGVPYAPVVAHGLVLVGTNVGVLYAIGGGAK